MAAMEDVDGSMSRLLEEVVALIRKNKVCIKGGLITPKKLGSSTTIVAGRSHRCLVGITLGRNFVFLF